MSSSLEVVMRPPEVFVRELSPEEGARLKSISKCAKYQSKRQRAMILLASSTGIPAPQIAGVVRTDESPVRKPSSAGWSIYLTDGREVARFRGLGSHRRALRYVSQLGRSTHQRWWLSATECR
jgi:hypothetical protein